MKSLILLIFAAISISAASAQTAKVASVEIQTSSVCDMCKDRIEAALFKTKGVIDASLTVSTGKVVIQYRPKKITVEELRTVINNTGYDADDSPANAEAYDKLDACCKKEMGIH